MMHNDLIEQLRELLAKATKGPWQHHLSHIYGCDPDRELIAQFLNGPWLVSDRDLTVEAVNALPTLLDRIAYLECRLEVVPDFSEDADGIACRNDTIKLLDARIAALEGENERLREALAAKPWPPTDDDLKNMLADIIGPWWSAYTAAVIRETPRHKLSPSDIKGMYAVRDALAPYIARAALEEPKP